MKPSTSSAPIGTEARVALIDSVMVIAIPVSIYMMRRVGNTHPMATALLHIEQHFYQFLYRASFCLDPEFLITTLTCTLGGDCIGLDELCLKTSKDWRHSYGENHS
jgi:hypothetical protein